MTTILITGSTSGIGLGIAKAFAQKGNNIIFNGLEKNGAAIAQQIASEYKIEFSFSPADMLNPGQLREMVNLAREKFGSIDILVNNAGIQYVSPIETLKWDEIIPLDGGWSAQ